MFAELLCKYLGSSFDISAQEIKILEEHFKLLQRWNKVLNLTSIKEPREIVERHYGESLFLAQHMPPGALNIVDVGTGAGFPGVPLAIVRPDCAVTLVESHQRKGVFLKEATRSLKNTQIFVGRAVDITEPFDWSVSRAVKFEQIEADLFRLADHTAVLGASQTPGKRFTWNEPVQLPSGQTRFLWIGHRST